jgi:hypothetical protein
METPTLMGSEDSYNTSIDDVKQPPPGVEPKWCWEERVRIDRINVVTAAIVRYRDAGLDVPREWIDEMFDMPELPFEWVEILQNVTTTPVSW